MSKTTIICQSCGEDNDPKSEFCINCGSKLAENKESLEINEEENREKEFRNWKRSVPFTTAAIIFLTFIDLATGSGINWSYWATVPIFLFAILAPYLSFKLG